LNPRFALGLSGSQLFLLVTLPFLLAYFARQILRHAYRRAGPLVAPRALVHGRT
jgi:nitrate/nitrite transporter NarK